MTWTNQKHQCSKKLTSRTRITKNYKQFYSRYNHKLEFVFRNTDSSNFILGSYRSYDYEKTKKLEKSLNKHGVAYKTMQNYYNALVYVEDVDAALKAIPRYLLNECVELQLMEDSVADFYNSFKTEDFKGVLCVKKKLPFGKYRYRVNFSNSFKKYASLDEQQLKNAAQLLKGYRGLYFPYDFEKRITRFKSQWGYYSQPYFYAENLDWLSMFLLVTPSIIHSIELFKTEEEINNGETVNES